MPQIGAAGKRSRTTHQADGQAHCTAGSGEQAHAEVGRQYIAPSLIQLTIYSVQPAPALHPIVIFPEKCLNFVFPLHFRMVNILLPAYSRNYSALHEAGLLTEAETMENQELEHLVLRERGVVWADQEGAGQQMKGDGMGEESQEMNEAGSTGLRSELAPVLSFSHLLYHQSSPCSKSSHSPVVVYLT